MARSFKDDKLHVIKSIALNDLGEVEKEGALSEVSFGPAPISEYGCRNLVFCNIIGGHSRTYV